MPSHTCRSTAPRILRCLVPAAFLMLILGAAPAGADGQGFLYGRVTTDAGREYEGFLRWDGEEACWDDLFHSSKEDLPYRDEVDEDELRRDRRRDRSEIRIFGKLLVINSDGESHSTRLCIARFGDIARIEVTGDQEAEIHLKGGSQIDVSGYSNDVGGIIEVDDRTLGQIDLRWSRIETIEFLPVPEGAQPPVERLHGTVETDAGVFTGFIQWDKEECLSTDELDGDTEDGKVSIEMGRIAAIERRGRSSSLVELRDGRSLRLTDSNDVDADNRGIMIEDPRYGRVTVGWDAFDRIEFSALGPSGRGYGEFGPSRPLQGVVVDHRGREHRGRLVFDLDESEDWEMLNGSIDSIEYDIPFRSVATIQPLSSDRSLVTLRNGEELRLEESSDVSEDNDGVLVYENSRDPIYIAWKDVEEIRFD